MFFSLTMPILAVAATVMAQTTTAPSTSATGTAPYNYCTSTTGAENPRFTPGATGVVPPIPCVGAYFPPEGFCCMGRNASCVEGDCQCVDTDRWWRLPLDDCVENNPQWSGCPGNMQKGLCCSGPDVALEGKELTPVCPTGTPVFTVWMANGTISTSSFPVSTTSLSSPTTTSLTTSSSPAAAGRTAAPGQVLLAAIALAGAGGLAAAI